MNISGIRYGHSIARQYKNAKIRRNFFAIHGALSSGLVVMGIKEGSNSAAALFTGSTILFATIAKKYQKTIKSLEPTYQEILKRAKTIYKK